MEITLNTFMDFKGFFQEFEMKGVVYRPNYYIPSTIPKTGIRMSGAAKMNPLAVVSPSRPYQPIYRVGKLQVKSQIINKKH